MLRIAGYFVVHEKYPTLKIKDLIEVTGASILYGACREMLANLTARGSHGVVSLPSVSFVPPRKESAATALRLAENAPRYRTGRRQTKKQPTK